MAFSVLLNLFILTIGSGIFIYDYQRFPSSYEDGFTSDLIRRRFAGGISLDNGGNFAIDDSPTSGQYVGNPSPEIDSSWDKLSAGLNIDLGGSDANDLDGKTFQWPDSDKYFTGLEVFHSLHCLNRLRQALYPDYYTVFDDPIDPSREAHIGHCINHLRQALQCHADLTPMNWKLVGNKLILDTNAMHTCRDFDAIHDWVFQRRTNYYEKEAVVNGSILIVD
ncbi:hypothetical protein BP6252_08130 [Coleophoma cylindrospora]|uniref:Uncharacterized protein n=1 Tax=Coleophoma cylindrospora TaxID=1849047 RepID=A0A3D8RBY5_9HELO|nr:hypothetical protein BP6252_08130 [Coleophoma cylindrospora]